MAARILLLKDRTERRTELSHNVCYSLILKWKGNLRGKKWVLLCGLDSFRSAECSVRLFSALVSVKGGEFLDYLSDYQLLKELCYLEF
jgi:hypothetical protein